MKNAILEASERYGEGFSDIAATFELSKSQLAGILRGEIDTEIDLWKLFALSEYCKIDLDIDIKPKKKAEKNTDHTAKLAI